MASKPNQYYVEKALKEIDVIISYTKDLPYEEFISDSKLVDATMFRLIQLIEQVKNIADEFKKSHPQIEWGNIIGFRNGIVHEYGRTDYTTVYEIISKDIYELKEVLEK